MIDVLKEPKRETRKAPPKKWRNWWLMNRFVRDHYTGLVHSPGERVPSSRLWPSKDIAETYAAQTLSESMRIHGVASMEYLGAEPEE